jgi:nucleotide-binding universal stress UspA family protein
MFKHLLVPLDGSRLAEAALPVAAAVAGRVKGTLTLVHVIERNAPSEVHNERHLVTSAEAEAYLAEVARLSLLAGLTVRTHVHEATVTDVARAITEHTAEFSPDLIVMTTHGRGSARRMLSGAIAQQVIGQGATPVLLVRPIEHLSVTSRGDWRRILAPIDGDEIHEKSLPIAAELALAFACPLHLLMVTPTLRELSGSEAAAGMLLPGATRLKLEMDNAGARDYVETRAEEMRRGGVETICETSRGDPAAAIVRAARRLSVDLVVMGTHGRAGTVAFWERSVAARVIAKARVPLLLVPLKE